MKLLVPYRVQVLYWFVAYGIFFLTFRALLAIHYGEPFSVTDVVGQSAMFALVLAAVSNNLDNLEQAKQLFRSRFEVAMIVTLIVLVPVLHEHFWRHSTPWVWSTELAIHSLFAALIFAEMAINSYALKRLRSRYLAAAHV